MAGRLGRLGFVGVAFAGVAFALAAASCGGTSEPETVAAPDPSPTAADPTPTPQPEVEPTPVPPTPEPEPVDEEPAPVAVPATFEAGVMPIINETCAQCHTGEGPGTQHVRFDTAADIAANASDIALVVGGQVMPPWPASVRSAPFLDDWSLTAEQIAAVTAWHQNGAELDVPADTAITPTLEVISLADVDVEIAPDAGFDGDPSYGDEYRCLVYDPQLTESAWLEGFEFVPDQGAVVHHAIGYRVSGALRQAASDKGAAQTDGGGWTCFGGSGLGIDEIFVGWAPGQRPTQFPEGSGLRLDPGEFLVIQIHYHFDIDAPEDRSSIRLDFADDGEQLDEVHLETLVAPAEIPCTTDEQGPLCDRATALAEKVGEYGFRGAPADFILGACGYTPDDFAAMTDGIATSSCDWPVEYGGQLISVLGHEHELGRSFRMTLNPGRPDERVLLDIPRWDFDWQFNYDLAEDVTVDEDDEIRIECSWDRSLRDPDLEPAYVLWADGTDDEMCFATVVTRSAA